MKIIRIFSQQESAQKGWTLIEALAAIVVVGIGVALFTKVQRMTSRDSKVNSKILLAGKMIEKHLEDTRIFIAADTTANWNALADTTIVPVAPDDITIVRKVSKAYSPQDNIEVANVKQLEISATWTTPYNDTIKVMTDVAKRF